MTSWTPLPHFTSFDDYVAAFPEGKDCQGAREAVLFVQGSGLHGSLAGGYLYITVASDSAVVVSDNDSWRAAYKTADVKGELDILKELAPVTPILLGFVGYERLN